MRYTGFCTALLLSLAACGSDSPTAINPVGTWILVGANESVLPAVIRQDASGRLEVLEGRLELRTGGLFDEHLSLRNNPSNAPPSTFFSDTNGTYTVSGGNVTFTLASGRSYSGRISGAILTYDDGTMRARYQRR